MKLKRSDIVTSLKPRPEQLGAGPGVRPMTPGVRDRMTYLLEGLGLPTGMAQRVSGSRGASGEGGVQPGLIDAIPFVNAIPAGISAGEAAKHGAWDKAAAAAGGAFTGMTTPAMQAGLAAMLLRALGGRRTPANLQNLARYSERPRDLRRAVPGLQRHYQQAAPGGRVDASELLEALGRLPGR